MKIDEERKLFLYELNGHGYDFVNSEWDFRNNRFVDEYLNMVWEMWLASRNREGYVLIPIETLEETLSWSKIAEWDSPNKQRDEEITKHVCIIENAMIGGHNE